MLMVDTIVIGNAVPKFNKYSFPRLDAYWEVDNIAVEGAPNFPNVPNNFSLPKFVQLTNLYGFFNRVIGSHSYCKKRVAIGLTKEDAQLINNKLQEFRENLETTIIHYVDLQRHNLKVLEWLNWWVNWAVNNCETPAIQAY